MTDKCLRAVGLAHNVALKLQNYLLNQTENVHYFAEIAIVKEGKIVQVVSRKVIMIK
jgi:hypothetical protein